MTWGLAPEISGELTSCAFYRFECAIRSAAILGIVGVGGLGFQLDTSFQSLKYDEMWTLIAALMVLSIRPRGRLGRCDAMRRCWSPP